MDPRRWPAIATTNQKEEFKKWKNNLSDLLVIQKEGIDLLRAAVFFRNELDIDIPFEKMGFVNPYEFFYHCQDILQLRASNNKYFLFIREDACPPDQRHLRQLARGQANSKIKSGIGRGIKIRPTYNTTHPVPIGNLLKMNQAQMFMNRVPRTTEPMRKYPPRTFNSNSRPSTSRSYNQNQRSLPPRFQALQQQQRSPQPKAQPSRLSNYSSHQSFAPGPPIRSHQPLTSNQNHLNFDNYERESDYSSDEVDSRPSSYSIRPKYGYGENASVIPAYPMTLPSFQTGNSNATVVPPPAPPTTMNIRVTFENSNFHNRYLKAINSEENEGHRPVVPALPATSNTTTTASTIPLQRPKEALNLKNLDKGQAQALVENGKNVSNHKHSSSSSSFEDYGVSSSDEYEWVEKDVTIPTYPRPKENETPKNAITVPSPSHIPQIKPLTSIDTFDRVGRSPLFSNAINSVINQGPSNKHVDPRSSNSSNSPKPVETSSNTKNMAEIKNSSTSPSMSVPVPTQAPFPIYKTGNAPPPSMTPFKNLTETVEKSNSLSSMAQRLSSITLSNMNNLEDKENLLGKNKNISTSPNLVKKPEDDPEKKKREEQKAINSKKLEEKVGRIFIASVSIDNATIQTYVKPLPDFIDHEMVVVYVPVKNALESFYVKDIRVMS